MRILKIHLFAQFSKGYISETACAKKVKCFANGFSYSVLYAKFKEDSRSWVDISQKKYKLSMD